MLKLSPLIYAFSDGVLSKLLRDPDFSTGATLDISNDKHDAGRPRSVNVDCSWTADHV